MRRLAALLAVMLLVAACDGGAGGADDGAQRTLLIGGIPDQDVSVLEERFGGVADVLEEEVGIPVEYRESTDYAALVTAFRNGDVPFGWFGGLTGVQARLAVEDAHAVAQRPVDSEFHSVFIVGPGVESSGLTDLEGLSFTFGSENSTSGHLMPRHFLREAGVDAETAFDAAPNYSGSHDRTWKLVQAGTYQAGALNEAVWDRAVGEGEVDPEQVRVVERTPAYYDYHWVAHPVIDERYGQGTTDRIIETLLTMHESDGEQSQRVLDLFEAERFVATEDANYEAIADVARDLELIE